MQISCPGLSLKAKSMHERVHAHPGSCARIRAGRHACRYPSVGRWSFGNCPRTCLPVSGDGRREPDLCLHLVSVGLHRDAGAHDVLVAMDVVDARHWRPVFLRLEAGQRERRQFARVGVCPLAGADHGGGVRRVFQRVVLAVKPAVLDRADFLADLDHRVDEAVQLMQRFALGRLDHQRAGHRKAKGRRVEAEVDQPLGDILGFDAGGVLERAQVEDALVCNQTVAARVQRGIVRREPPGDVVGVEQGDLGRLEQSLCSHQGDVHPADRQDAGRSVTGGRHHTYSVLATILITADGDVGISTGQERGEMGFHCARPHMTCLLRNLYAGQEATVRTGHGTTDWFQIRKGVRQGCILSPYLFNLYAEYIMRSSGLEEAQAGIKIAGRNINNLRYADDTTLMAESEEELKSLLMTVKVESEKVGLKLNIQKTKIMASGPITSWDRWETVETVSDFISFGLQNHCRW